MDIQKSNCGYPKIELWISKIQQKNLFWISIIRFLDIDNSIFGYPIFSLIYGYPKSELWISQNRILDIQKQILDIQKSCLTLHIHNSIFGYQYSIMDIQKSIFVYRKIILDIHTLDFYNYFLISQNILLDIQK